MAHCIIKSSAHQKFQREIICTLRSCTHIRVLCMVPVYLIARKYISVYIMPLDIPKDRLALKELQLDKPQDHLRIGYQHECGG